ncbi:hypothetical protein [Vibrio campbellii]|uniref:hypothetical protein n=1 Tax=Vibrio campbellii TaxID=680 RepID=UPI00210CA809|nr:hypothetical protein [Vibrio campbellii]
MEAFAHFHGDCLNQYLWFTTFVLMTVIFEGSFEVSELFPSFFLPSLISAQEIQVWSGIEYSTVAEINERFQEETGNTLAIREFDVNNIRSELLLAKQTGITVPDVIWCLQTFLVYTITLTSPRFHRVG